MAREKTASEIYHQGERIFQASWRIATKRAARVHPETGGNHCLVHNWGNDEARAVWAWQGSLWASVKPAIDAAYHAALHREHGPHFRPLWCAHCKVLRNVDILAA